MTFFQVPPVPLPDPTATPFGYIAPPTFTPSPIVPALTPSPTTVSTIAPTLTPSVTPTWIPTWTPDPRWPTPEPLVMSGVSDAQAGSGEALLLVFVVVCLVLLAVTALVLWSQFYKPRA